MLFCLSCLLLCPPAALHLKWRSCSWMVAMMKTKHRSQLERRASCRTCAWTRYGRSERQRTTPVRNEGRRRDCPPERLTLHDLSGCDLLSPISASLSLFYSHHVKSSVLDYATAAMRFALCGVPADVVSCNRLILLHGPPGTGHSLTNETKLANSSCILSLVAHLLIRTCFLALLPRSCLCARRQDELLQGDRAEAEHSPLGCLPAW